MLTLTSDNNDLPAIRWEIIIFVVIIASLIYLMVFMAIPKEHRSKALLGFLAIIIGGGVIFLSLALSYQILVTK